MLCLSRKTGQEIQIGPHITVKVVAIQGNRVMLGINAPQSVVIDRGEVAQGKTQRADAERRRQRQALANVGLADRVRRRQAQVA